MKKRVVIVGGGLAGLSTAESLLRNHGDRFDVTIIESKRQTGGRAGSFDDPKSNQAIDYCQHVAMGCCTNLLALLDRHDLGDSMRRYRELLFLCEGYQPSRFKTVDWLPAPFHLAFSISTLQYLTWSQQRMIRRAMLRLMRTNSSQLQKVTAAVWLKDNGQDTKTIRDFWDVILVSALGESTQWVAMSAARKVLMDGFAAAKGASDVLVPNRPLRQLIGVELTGAIERLGATVRSETPVYQVVDSPKGIKTSAGEFIESDHVVSAVPWHQLSKLVRHGALASSVDNLDAIDAIPASPITGLHLWFDREITKEPHCVLVGTIAQWLFRSPIASAEQVHETHSSEYYYQVVISGSREARQIPKDELVQQVHRELRRAFPATSSARLIRSQIIADPYSVFSVRPEVESIRPAATTQLNWFHLAGDWIATGWPATMEGAVISGVMATNSILQSEGLPATPQVQELPRGWWSQILIRP